MHILCVFSKYNYGLPIRGEGYEYANFVPALRHLGHEITLFENWDRTQCRNFRELNQNLLQEIERVKPDVVLAVQTHFEIWLETWQMVRDSGIAATVNWATDDSWKYPQFSRFMAPVFHAFTTTYPDIYEQYHRDGHYNVLLTQWAASATNLQPPRPSGECLWPVTFVGTAHGNRPKWIDALRRRGVEVACFGHGWRHGSVKAAEIPDIIRKSVISLNFSTGSYVWQKGRFRQNKQIKARTFEVPGAGGFLLTERVAGLERYYSPGIDIETFDGIEDLVRKIHYYLSHTPERDRIAQSGYERTRTEHTYEQRLAAVLEFALAQRNRLLAQSNQPPTGKFDWKAFDDVARLHHVTPQLDWARRVLMRTCSAVWGPVRGPRAARRLVFELSWRLQGQRTYSSAGLPGRLFYFES